MFEEGHGPEDVLPLLAQTAIRAAREKGEEDTAEIQALIQHEVDFMQVGACPKAPAKDCFLFLKSVMHRPEFFQKGGLKNTACTWLFFQAAQRLSRYPTSSSFA